MLSGVVALLEEPAVLGLDRDAETVEDADVTGRIDRVDHCVGALDVNGESGVSRDIDALGLEQKPAHGDRALDRVRVAPGSLAAISPQRPRSGVGAATRAHRRGGRQRVLVCGPEQGARQQQPGNQGQPARNGHDVSLGRDRRVADASGPPRSR